MDKRLTPARIALLYAAFASLWIFASDKLLALVLPDPALIIRIGMFKGFAFVAVTTWLLYQLIKTSATKVVPADSPDEAKAGLFKARNLLAIFLGLALVVPLFGYGIARFYSPHVRQAAFDDLTAIAELKSGQIETWLHERDNDVVELAERTGLIEKAAQWLEQGDTGARQYVAERLVSLTRTHGYEPVLLYRNGGPALPSATAPDPVSGKLWRELLKKALSDAKAQRSELYRDGNGKIRLDYVVPIHLSGPQRVIGAIVLRAPVEQFLFPLVQSWPTSSPSAETVLTRRDGGEILHLNELRHRKGTALSLRVPLDNQGAISAAAIRLDTPQTLEGTDYRGVRVLAAARPIPGTDWHLVAKVDRDEVMALFNEMLFWVSLVAIVAVMVVASAVLMLWRQQQRVHQLALVARTAEMDKQLKLFYELPFIGMSITSPVTRQWLYVNDRLCDMLGYSRAELLQTTWSDITHPDDVGGNLKELERIKTGESDGFSMEKRFLRKDGTPLAVNIVVKCVRDTEGKPSHIVAMIEDISERKRIEQALRESEDRFRNIFANAIDGILLADAESRKFVMANPAIERMLGYDSKEILSLGVEDIHPAEALTDVLNAFEKQLTGELTLAHDLPVKRKDGSVFHAEINSAPITIDGKPYLLGNFRDITERKRAETALRESEDRFRSIFDNAIDGIALLDAETRRIAMANQAFERMLGYGSGETIGFGFGDFHPAEALPEINSGFGRRLAGDVMPVVDLPLMRKDGSLLYANINAAPLSIGGKTYMMAIFRDISERKKTEAALRQSATVFENSHDGITITDLDGRILAVNRAFLKITGYSEAEVLGQNPRILHSGRQSRDFYQDMWANIKQAGYWHGEIWNRRKNGEIYPEWLTISAVKNAEGQTTHYVGTFSDLSQIKQSEERAEHLAHYDPLTDLPNRLLVLSHLNHVLTRAQRHHRHVGVLYLDLDRFKNINDSLGYPVGDELLVKLTERLTMHMRSEDMLARLGGDEFLLVLEYMEVPEDAAIVARSLLELLTQAFALSGEQEIFIGASIGISVFPNDGSNADQLIQYADAAMHQAKQQGRNTFQFYTDSLTRASGRHLELETRLRHAITANQLRVYYQPQVDIATGHIVGAEALVRWQDPERGLIPPVDFIPLAEETGLIGAIGEWVLKEACLQGVRWIDAGLPFLTLAVNLSPHQFMRGSIVDTVSKILAETGFPADRLELELTESALMQQEENAVRMLHLLRALDIRLAIDDFGTGYSSLSYLKRFPLDILKIDKSFVDDIPFHQDDMEIAATIIAMGHSLGFKVLAEGVETKEQLDFLQSKGCDMYQGYLTSPPLPPAQFEKLLERPA
ncbi:MAG: PAS domain S-box protein [Nitrosomonadales bacterium]|nr:PAS domain S-box protein [Nitrosomonadales bacterium]